MTKKIITYLGLILFNSCSTKTEEPLLKTSIPSDTTIVFETSNQKVELVIGKDGKISSIELNPDTNSQTVYFSSDGLVDVMTIRKGKRDEQSLWFNPNGQLKKIKSFDFTDTCGGDQFIWFANSDSKSLLIDYDATHVPLICGLKDTFKINIENILTFKTINSNSDNATIELREMRYDTTAIVIKIDSKVPNRMTVTGRKKGTYKITGEVSTSFLKHKPVYGILNKLDFNLTFS